MPRPTKRTNGQTGDPPVEPEKAGDTRFHVVPLSDLFADQANTRVHSERNLQTIESSLRQFGAGRSLVIDGDNIVRAGNGTIEAAAKQGITEVLVIEPGPGKLVAVRRPEWSPTEATAYAIADNRSTDLSLFDVDSLTKQLNALEKEGLDLKILGWSDYEMKLLRKGNSVDGDAGDEPDKSEPDDKGDALALIKDAVRPEPKTQVKAGDRFTMGVHHLICSDVIRGWPAWKELLLGEALFMPYPSPFLPLAETDKAFVMVQPDTYLCAVMCDLYDAANPGAGTIRCP